ncbi:MAG: DUF420 domain-containing protein [Gemmatimonadota bacterium]|nr:MAG: DUF420 domain-containing protein [Gemmatimonadota bacterium]
MSVHDLPTVNATLNGMGAITLLCGYLAIRRRRIDVHRACMISAVAISVLFLASYLFYHYQVGATRFAGQGWSRPVYFTILTTHTVLAAAIVPLVVVTLVRAARGAFERHRRIARVTLPIWLYVSVTGILVYLMLYHIFAGP